MPGGGLAGLREPRIEPVWFESAFYRKVARRGLELEAAGTRPDAVTLLPDLSPEERAEILRCAEQMPRVSGYTHYAEQLREEWRQRSLRAALQRIGASGENADGMTAALRGWWASRRRRAAARPRAAPCRRPMSTCIPACSARTRGICPAIPGWTA